MYFDIDQHCLTCVIGHNQMFLSLRKLVGFVILKPSAKMENTEWCLVHGNKTLYHLNITLNLSNTRCSSQVACSRLSVVRGKRKRAGEKTSED